MNERFAEKMAEEQVRKDTHTVGDFVSIYCDGHHKDRERSAIVSDAAELGVYGNKPPVLCEECAEHLRYAEKRRAYCPKDPKPFCAHCDTHCYRSEERAWQQDMMRYAGPRSVWRGYAIQGMKHAVAARKHRIEAEQRAATAVQTEREDS